MGSNLTIEELLREVHAAANSSISQALHDSVDALIDKLRQEDKTLRQMEVIGYPNIPERKWIFLREMNWKRSPRVITPFSIAKQFVGLAEVPGAMASPIILGMLQLDTDWPKDDATSWCAAFANFVLHCAGAERSHKLNARSYLNVGTEIRLQDATPGWDVVVFWRGSRDSWQGHVGFYAGRSGANILCLGGNQNDQVSIAEYSADRLLGVRRISRVAA